MSATTLRLITAYRRQEHAYQRVLELARSGLAGVRSGRSLNELEKINREKESLLADVGRIDGEIEAERALWDADDSASRDTAELEQLLTRIGTLIESILAEERETDRWIAHGAGRAETSVVTS